MFKNKIQVAKDYLWPLFISLVAMSFFGPQWLLLGCTWVPGMAVYRNSTGREKIMVCLVMMVYLASNAGYILFSDYPKDMSYWMFNRFLNIVVFGFVLSPLADWLIERKWANSWWGLWALLALPCALVLYVFVQHAKGHAEGEGYTTMILADDAGFGLVVALMTSMVSSKELIKKA